MQSGKTEHYITVDPNNAWRSDPLGGYLRVRGRGAVVLIAAAMSALLLLSGHWTGGTAVLICGLALAIGLGVVGRSRRRRQRAAEQLHLICHETRDDVAALLGTAPADAGSSTSVGDFHRNTAERIAKFFREVMDDKSVNCAIRLAEIIDGRQYYVTRARSGGLNQSRPNHSEPVAVNCGLPQTLMNKGRTGVFIIRSIPSAIKAGIWMRTENDGLTDIRTLMVCPINGWENGQKVMLGILYVTSQRNRFDAIHTIPFKALADLLGLVYPVIVDSIRASEPGVSGTTGTKDVP